MPSRIPPPATLRTMSEREAHEAAIDYEYETGRHMDSFMEAWYKANAARLEAEHRAKHPKLSKFADFMNSAGKTTVKAAKKADKAFCTFMEGGKKTPKKSGTTRKTTAGKTTGKKTTVKRCPKCGQKITSQRKSPYRR